MLAVALLASLAATPGPRSAPPTTGRELITAMHDRYAGRWYHTLTFVQTTTLANGRTETWYEAASIPGRLRIDFGVDTARTTLLFAGDSIYQFHNGAVAGAQPFVHPLMVLGFDVYAQPVERTVAQLTTLGFDLGPVHADSWHGRPVYVVGAPVGDTLGRQFWVDQERLVFVRMIEPSRRDPAAHIVTEFNDYRPLGPAWIAAEVRATINGKVVQFEQYDDIKADPALPEDLWNAGKLPTATWMGAWH